jgi:ABC-type nitrate/sulfonate/bicarbonate transport system substrate-binding protein
MDRRQFVASLSSAAALSSLSAVPQMARAASGSLIPLRYTLDFRVTAQTSPFLLALSKGYYRAEGLDVTIDTGSGSVASITRVASGAYDMGQGDISSLIEFQARNGAGVKAVYQYYDRAPFVIIGRKDRGITTDFHSLKGKRVAAAAVESTRRLWPMVERQLKLPANFFQWVTTDFSVRDNVMLRGDVDAATYFHDSATSLFARLPEDKLSVLSYANTGLNLYGNAIVANDKLLKEKPEAVRAFLRATNRAILETIRNPEPSLAAVRAREPILELPVERKRWAITRSYVAGPDTRTVGLGSVTPEHVAQQIAGVVQTFGLSKSPSVEELYDLSFLPPLADRLIKA